MVFINKILKSLNIGSQNNQLLIARHMEKDFNNSYPVYVDHYLSYEIGALNLPPSIIEEIRNDFEFNTWFLNNFTLVMFSYGWLIGFLNKNKNSYYEIKSIIDNFNEESKEHFLVSADEILNYFRHNKIANIYTMCGTHMFHEGKDAGTAYNGSIEITKM